MRVTEDEADSMAAGCDESKCWAQPGQFCKTPSGARRRPHPARVTLAGRLGLTGGAGRAWMAEHRLAVQVGSQVSVGGTRLVLPSGAAGGDGSAVLGAPGAG